MKIFMMAASLRADSLNKKLANVAQRILEAQEVQVEHINFESFKVPLYDGDEQEANGIVQAAEDFAQKMSEADGTIIVTPEYNFSIPGTLKNLIDWVSRIQPMPFKGQCMMVMSASPSLVGGNRGLMTTKVPLEGCGACVHPSMFSLASAHEAFTDDGSTLKDANMQKRLEDTLMDFMQYTRKLNA